MEEWDEQRVEQALFGERQVAKRLPEQVLPDFPALHSQLQQHRHLTLQLAWEEYRQVHPEGYGYSRLELPTNCFDVTLLGLVCFACRNIRWTIFSFAPSSYKLDAIPRLKPCQPYQSSLISSAAERMTCCPSLFKSKRLPAAGVKHHSSPRIPHRNAIYIQCAIEIRRQYRGNAAGLGQRRDSQIDIVRRIAVTIAFI